MAGAQGLIHKYAINQVNYHVVDASPPPLPLPAFSFPSSVSPRQYFLPVFHGREGARGWPPCRCHAGRWVNRAIRSKRHSATSIMRNLRCAKRSSSPLRQMTRETNPTRGIHPRSFDRRLLRYMCVYIYIYIYIVIHSRCYGSVTRALHGS